MIDLNCSKTLILHSLKPWQADVNQACCQINAAFSIHQQNFFTFFYFESHGLIINLIDVNPPFSPITLKTFQMEMANKNHQVINLWEDVWAKKPTQVCARLASLMGLNKSIYGRTTKVVKITKPQASAFFNAYHLQAYVKSRHNFALKYQDEIVAAAAFSALRKMKHSENYYSVELIRFATKAGFTVTGGLSKLIHHFVAQFKPDDIMTYADCDWTDGVSYVKLNFVQIDVLNPQYFVLNENGDRILQKNKQSVLPPVFNTGSLKFVLKTPHGKI